MINPSPISQTIRKPHRRAVTNQSPISQPLWPLGNRTDGQQWTKSPHLWSLWPLKNHTMNQIPISLVHMAIGKPQWFTGPYVHLQTADSVTSLSPTSLIPMAIGAPRRGSVMDQSPTSLTHVATGTTHRMASQVTTGRFPASFRVHYLTTRPSQPDIGKNKLYFPFRHWNLQRYYLSAVDRSGWNQTNMRMFLHTRWLKTSIFVLIISYINSKVVPILHWLFFFSSLPLITPPSNIYYWSLF